MKHIFYILSFLFSFGLFAQNQELFEKANALYNQGKYAEAIDNYNAILETENHSADLYFNLANAHYKLNNVGPSIYYYEKALLLNPEDSDIINNIAFAKNMTIDAIDIVPDVGFSKLLNTTTHKMSFDQWAKTSIAIVFCFVVLFLVYYFAYSTSKKRLAFMGSISALVLVCITLAFAFHKFNLDKLDNPAIIFAQESKVKSNPNSRSEESFRLHEGTKVQVLETYEDWKKIQLSDGKVGWVINDDIKILKDF
ncbi:MAG: tetratricopeptide repeat protein [Algibacter sp.]|uniref:tetratricopeptide repeat protein n=1 Tax=Algibacter sp. TaxID=1872428 RepID=UPI00262DC30C|nr:tetratricopeptide repeat protein [Algibacter sp.]MDG1730790.1 tetratricopeptide repeat protein [Algibacter sp.]MDG2177367.1 tetratricopeptide repeat protein [Algibacter sp.]